MARGKRYPCRGQFTHPTARLCLAFAFRALPLGMALAARPNGHALAIDSSVRDDHATPLRKTAVQLGMIGLGRMGANMARRVMSHGHSCVVQDSHPDAVARMVSD